MCFDWNSDLDQISNLKISEKIYFESIDVLSAQNISTIKNKKIEKLLSSITKI